VRAKHVTSNDRMAAFARFGRRILGSGIFSRGLLFP